MKTSPTINGPRITLRHPSPKDAEAFSCHPRDEEIQRMYGLPPQGGIPSQSEAEAWLTKLLSHAPYGWVIEFEGKAIGEARFNKIDPKGERRASYAIGMFDKSALGKGLGTEATRLVCQHGFEELGLHRIYLRVAQYNSRAIASYKKVGFVEEGVERECFQMDGQWYNDVIMGCLESDFIPSGGVK